jgi:glycosyltransferase A (GT-A) superfamily protein (DUF2064 family)
MTPAGTTLVLIAKECIPGRVKTRLHPPFTLEEAASIASACLLDTLAAVAQLPARRRILYFDGAAVPPEADGWEVIAQPSGGMNAVGLDERIAAIFDRCEGPTILIGMDTPQVSRELLAPVFEPWPSGVDAWFGPAHDGGFWALGLGEPRGEVVRGELIRGDLIRGVPMSRGDTGSIQRQRLLDAGLVVRDLPELVDIDTVDELFTVADALPGSRLAQAVRSIRVGVR